MKPPQGGFVVLCEMQIHFWTIGKNHETYVESGISDFTRRINNYFPASWKIIPTIRNASLHTEQDLRRKEGEIILKMLGSQDYLVTLDENGRTWCFLLAAHMASIRKCSNAQIIFGRYPH
jgi:23S rRNA pseudoU1915 N3-methylase RlmH